ncbi:MAG: GntR family transcriptional regulator [Pseudonocardia sp.]|nr:GntR family transcriptional regulator [Pseudonocardia sp.]
MVRTHSLAADRVLLMRTSTAERVAAILRARISEGHFQPGERLTEEEITEALGVSRNTLREAFRLLTHERLLVHELNRGVFVRVPDVADLRDLYRVRKHVECSVLREATVSPADLTRLTAAVEQGKQALRGQDWRGLGTANIQFHEALVALAGSERLAELMRAVLAELRLVFAVMANAERFHRPYLEHNEEILVALQSGDGDRAAELLRSYLDDAERQLVEAYSANQAEQRG